MNTQKIKKELVRYERVIVRNRFTTTKQEERETRKKYIVNKPERISDIILTHYGFDLKSKEEQLHSYRQATKNLGSSVNSFKDIYLEGEENSATKESRKKAHASLKIWLEETVSLLRQV